MSSRIRNVTSCLSKAIMLSLGSLRRAVSQLLTFRIYRLEFFVQTANRLTCDETNFAMSLMYNINNNGLSTVPCGTPESTTH